MFIRRGRLNTFGNIVYNTVQIGGIFENIFERKNKRKGKVSYSHQGCIYLLKNTVKTVALWNSTIYITFLFKCHMILQKSL